MPPSVSRRSAAVGAAWAVPSLAVAAAAPALAASPVPAVKGSSFFYGYYDEGFRGNTITGEVRPTQSTSLSTPSFTVTNGPAVVTDLTIVYWLPTPSYVFTSQSRTSPWTVLTRDTSRPNLKGPSTGVTFYPYSTTYAGVSTPVSSGPGYSFSAPAVTTTNPYTEGASYYRIFYTLNGTPKVNPLQPVQNP